MRFFRAFAICVSAVIAAAICSIAAHAQVDPTPGSFHTQNPGSFNAGTGKIVDLEIGAGSNATAVVVQPDGRIVLAGYCDTGTGIDFCLARLNRNGTLDTTFDGPATQGIGDGKFSFPFGLGSDQASALALQADGKILVGGQCGVDLNRFSFCIARLLSNGEHDVTFGTFGSFGKVSIPGALTGNDLLATILIRPNGKIVLVGTCLSLTNFCVVQLNADGSLDNSFDGGGKLAFQIAETSNSVGDAKLLPDGRIVMVGLCSSPSSATFCAARINADGTFDDTFDGSQLPAGDGRFQLLMPTGGGTATSLAIQADGMMVIGGYCSNGSNLDFCVARLRQDGTFDPQFDGPLGNGDGRFLLPMTASANEFLRAVEVQPDGKLLLFGTCGQNISEDFCIARLYDDGRLDRSFDGGSGNANGKFSLPLVAANSDSATAMALQSDGRILLAGSCATAANGNARFCVARLNGGPYAASECRLDVDGDGAIVATIDSLIVSRVQRGMRGAAVLSGIAFASHTARTTWPAIRDYLVAHCGLAVY
jgi:uncharacterized delta-60 repeat protein